MPFHINTCTTALMLAIRKTTDRREHQFADYELNKFAGVSRCLVELAWAAALFFNLLGYLVARVELRIVLDSATLQPGLAWPALHRDI